MTDSVTFERTGNAELDDAYARLEKILPDLWALHRALKRAHCARAAWWVREGIDAIVGAVGELA